MTLQTRTWWILTTLLAILFVGSEWWRAEQSILAEAGRSRAMAYDVAPRARNVEEVGKMIGYPEKALRAGIEGKVILRVWISATGYYQRHEVVSADHPLLRMACEVRIPLMRFEPAIKDGLPVPSQMEIPFTFSLGNK